MKTILFCDTVKDKVDMLYRNNNVGIATENLPHVVDRSSGDESLTNSIMKQYSNGDCEIADVTSQKYRHR
jgi:hypothetical protein